MLGSCGVGSEIKVFCLLGTSYALTETCLRKQNLFMTIYSVQSSFKNAGLS